MRSYETIAKYAWRNEESAMYEARSTWRANKNGGICFSAQKKKKSNRFALRPRKRIISDRMARTPRDILDTICLKDVLKVEAIVRSDITCTRICSTVVFHAEYLSAPRFAPLLRILYFIFWYVRIRGIEFENTNGSISYHDGFTDKRIEFSVERTRDESDAASAKVLHFYAEDRRTPQTFDILLQGFISI